MPEPITREEVYLNAIAQNTGGGDGGSVPEPITRTEQYLNQIVTNTAGGGGGGASLPAVTSENNGDVLTVVEGQWDKAAPSGGVLVVSVDTQTGALDHTWQEIQDADLPVMVNRDESGSSWTPIWGTYIEDGDYVVFLEAEGQNMDFIASSADGYPVLQMGNGGNA